MLGMDSDIPEAPLTSMSSNDWQIDIEARAYNGLAAFVANARKLNNNDIRSNCFIAIKVIHMCVLTI